MTPLELITALRRASEKATPGPWTHGFEDGYGERSDNVGGCIVGDTVVVRDADYVGHPVGVQSEENAAYIALANPTNIKVLLDTLERAVEALELIASEVSGCTTGGYYSCGALCADEAREALEKLK